eukprot:TRINITY_DN481_c1_g1_i6.p3 TRINITY_DN481_c1_g1~~TRINITY_DN481_c1_g1_i6.p3  ORF type:complete len:101 (+),score=30.43 TRINITY_DN481_c1_g1_i6:80-382(+)
MAAAATCDLQPPTRLQAPAPSGMATKDDITSLRAALLRALANGTLSHVAQTQRELGRVSLDSVLAEGVSGSNSFIWLRFFLDFSFPSPLPQRAATTSPSH